MALNLTIIFYFLIVFGIIGIVVGIVSGILLDGDYIAPYIILLAGITLTVVSVVTIKIAKPTQTEYDPAIYDWSKIEAENDVKIEVNENEKGEYLMGYTFGNSEYFVHYVTPTPTPIPPDPHPEWKYE